MTYAATAPDRRRERLLVGLLLVTIVLLRSAVFVLWEEAQFDADQAVMGLMAKHLSEGRAFPVFFYGSNHILAVQAWLAAPVFLLAGVSVTALKLPILAINVAITLLLLRGLERYAGLRPAVAWIPVLFFALPAPGTSAHLLEASGGNVEPLLYALLIWMTRNRPVWCGLIFGIGFLQREFTLYGLAALLVIDAIQGRLFTWPGIKARLAMLRVSAEVWIVAQLLRYSSSAAGPGTSITDLHRPHSNVTELAQRVCLDPQMIPVGFWRIITEHWPVLFGTRPQPMLDQAVASPLWQGLPYGWIFLAAALLIAAGGVAGRLLRDRTWRREYDFCAYLVLLGSFSIVGYVVGRCGAVDLLRYELLSLGGAVGLGGWFLLAVDSPAVRRVWLACVCACALIAAVPGARLLYDYAAHPRVGAKRLVARHLEARGLKYATSDYWLAYSLSFLTNERVIVASEDFVRIATYATIVEQHPDEVVRILRRSCPGGTPVAGVYLCPR